MKHLRIALLAAGLAVAASAQGQPNVVARVNGVAISQQQLDTLVKNLVAQGRQDTPQIREELKQVMINRELMTQEASRRGLDKTTEGAMRLMFARQEVLSNALMEDVFKSNPITDEILKKEYDRLKAQLGAREFKVRHILVAKEDEAKDITAQIKKGGSFEKLAAERSMDPGSKTNGGDLDWGAPGRFVKPFADAVVKMKKGQMTDAPVQSQYGWHIIRVDDERASRIPNFNEAKPEIQRIMQGQVLQKTMTDLRAKAKIE
jgi:peptidyl-prolyl cis-trans isomerase C